MSADRRTLEMDLRLTETFPSSIKASPNLRKESIESYCLLIVRKEISCMAKTSIIQFINRPLYGVLWKEFEDQILN
ncbi:hypothetical protein T4B_2615 [Trichinella pseudospiralis]|uniref:Uncharacterized protein n=1 Tax=Trichinella pseudospiralis TaxID=6337 RepID=A0A0V1JJ03_TRIPS|nr:hypothetical protein T4B_2615 [Trichinella pseudospiralis]